MPLQKSPERALKPSLETIPPEVRNQIWFLTESLVPTLHYPHENKFVPIDHKDNPEHWQQNLARVQHGRIIFDTEGKYLPQPAMTRVCRALRKETLEIYYGNSKFYVSRFFGLGSGELSRRYLLKWLEEQGGNLMGGSLSFSDDFEGIAVVEAQKLVRPGVVFGSEIPLKPIKWVEGVRSGGV